MAPGAVRGSWEDPGECLGCGGYIGHACGKLKSNYHMQRHTHTHTRACVGQVPCQYTNVWLRFATVLSLDKLLTSGRQHKDVCVGIAAASYDSITISE